MPRSRPAEFEVSSLVPASPEQVWERIITPAGINYELRPWMRMTLPRGFERLDPESVELGKPIGRSWVLLLGLLPFEYDDVTLVELEPGRRFLERSPMLSQRSWQHERIVEPAEGGLPGHRPDPHGAATGPSRRTPATDLPRRLPPPPPATAGLVRELGSGEGRNRTADTTIFRRRGSR